MTKQLTTIKMTDSEAVDYLDFIQDQIRVKYPDLTIELHIHIPYAPYILKLVDQNLFMNKYDVLHWSMGESFNNRIFNLKQWWENNQDKLKPYLRK